MNLTLSALTGHSGAGDNHLNLAVWDKATHTLTQGCSSKGDQTFIHGYSVAKSPPAAGGPLCPRVALPPGGSTEWIEVGPLLDSYSMSTPNVFFAPHLPRQKRVRVFSDHGTWNMPRGTYKIWLGVISTELQRRGATSLSFHRNSSDVETVATFSVANASLQLQVDASTRATKRVRGECAAQPSLMLPQSPTEGARHRPARRVLRDCGRARERSDSPLPEWSEGGIPAVLCPCVCAGQLTDRWPGQAQSAGEAQQEAGLYLRATTAGPALQRHGEFAYCFSALIVQPA